MGLLTWPLRLPLLPITALVQFAELIEQEAERQLDADIRRQLEDAEEARLSGAASEEEIALLEEQILRRLTGWGRDADGSAQERGRDA
ncbi:MAG TPA: gas vesicle protein G [Streptosporangiaceae bacterium]